MARPWRETRGWSSEEPAAPRLTRKDRRALGAPQGTDAWSQGGRRAHLPAVAGTKPSIAAHRHLRRQGSGKRSEGEVRPSDPLTSLVFSPTAASTPRSANGARGAPLADRSIDPPTHGRLCAATLLPARSSQEGQGFKDGSGEAVELQYYGTMRVQCVGTTVTRTMSAALRPHGTRRGLAAGTAGRPAQNAPEEAGELAGRPKERRCPMDSGTSQSYQRAPSPARGCPGAPAWTGACPGRQAASCWGLRTSPGSSTG